MVIPPGNFAELNNFLIVFRSSMKIIDKRLEVVKHGLNNFKDEFEQYYGCPRQVISSLEFQVEVEFDVATKMRIIELKSVLQSEVTALDQDQNFESTSLFSFHL